MMSWIPHIPLYRILILCLLAHMLQSLVLRVLYPPLIIFALLFPAHTVWTWFFNIVSILKMGLGVWSVHKLLTVWSVNLCSTPSASSKPYSARLYSCSLSVPCTHPEHDSFSLERPLINQRFDFVICDGQVLRTHMRPEYRERTEASRLTSAQLILALQRIRDGGTLVILWHKIESLDTMELLYIFSQFSDIEVFKPLRKHAIRSTFDLIAKNVQPSVESANVAVIAWKKAWWNATFGGQQGEGARRLGMDEKYA